MGEGMAAIGIGAVLSTLMWVGFRNLPGERWQIMAAIPVLKDETGHWRGMNLTYYGLFTALAAVTATAVFLGLSGAVGISLWSAMALVLTVCCLCLPASRIVARLVEKKPHTLTIGGAFFVGLVLAPWAVVVLDRMGTAWGATPVPALPALAAVAVAYAAGEGLGRLACISFGCCYGRPIAECPPLVQKVLSGRGMVFVGKTKKAAYEGGLEGRQVVPVQAMTCVLFVWIALWGGVLFLHGRYGTAFAGVVAATQLWRVISECLRADYRGGGSVSAYQVMALFTVFYALGAAILLSAQEITWPGADIAAGLRMLWSPEVIVILHAIGAVTFVHTGRSMVTASTIAFHVLREEV